MRNWLFTVSVNIGVTVIILLFSPVIIHAMIKEDREFKKTHANGLGRIAGIFLKLI